MFSIRISLATMFLALIARPGNAQPATRPAESDRLTAVVTDAVHAVQTAHPDYNLKDDDIAVTLIDLSDPAAPRQGDFRGAELIYPASVVKLFYLAYCQQLVHDGKLADTPELRRGMREMIVNSDNDATAYILYATTDAPNGAELPEKEMADWAYKRNAVNRYFASLGYPKINACQCPYSFGPFGRERAFLGPKFENRNAVSTNATALILSQIAARSIVSPQACDDMMALLKRDRSTTKPANGDDQAFGFSGIALPADWRLYSKAGWTNTARHDAAYVESPDAKTRFILTTFTTGHARQRDIIPGVLSAVLANVAPTPVP